MATSSNVSSTSTAQSNDSTLTHAIINNIPKEYHSSDLRNFFSQLIETKGFLCFHFRHRPEVKISTDDKSVVDNESSSASQSRCCVVRLTQGNMRKLLRMYHRKHWLDKKGSQMSQRCFISQIGVVQRDQTSGQYNNKSEHFT